jgi:E3 ubiquitin-protein ligase MARCH6
MDPIKMSPILSTVYICIFLWQGWAALGTKMKEWALIAGKASVAVILLMGLIPFLFGVLLDLVVLTPVRVPLHQSPIYFLWQVR